MAAYKLIRTRALIDAPNPQPGQRVRTPVLQADADGAQLLNGIFGSLPPASPGGGFQYHYHVRRESIIHLLAGDATEMVEGEAVPLKPGDIIYLSPSARHALVNNSTTEPVQFIEFYAPAAPDMVRPQD